MKIVAILLGLTAGACVYDAGERCGPAMTYDSSLRACVCDANAVPDGLGCTPCTDDEVVVDGTCSCAPGSAKNDANICERIAGLGDPCATGCSNPDYPFCAPATAGSSAKTCTKTCTSDDDCAPTYTCATWEPQPYCRTFSGLGKSCASASDCTGNDAAYCETFQSHACLVASCSLEADDCPRGSTCCSFASFGLPNICAEACQ